MRLASVGAAVYVFIISSSWLPCAECASGRRKRVRRKGKASKNKKEKSAKIAKEGKAAKETVPPLVEKVCLVAGEIFEIEGSTEEFVGPSGALIGPVCNGTNLEECLQKEGVFDAPFWFNRGSGPTTTFVFTEDEASAGKGSLKGSVGTDSGDKVFVEYWSDSTDLRNMDVSNLSYIQYDFFPEACPNATAGNDPCENEFYLNLYTRISGTKENFFDCRFDFVPMIGPTGEWTTYRIDLTSATARSVAGDFAGENCPNHNSTTQGIGSDILLDAANNNYVLGTGDFGTGSDSGYIFALNMGDSDSSDSGLVGYFDNIQLKLKNEDSVRVFDFEP